MKRKTACEKFICDSIYDFISEKWSEIDLERCVLDKEPKEKFLKEVRTKFETAMWVFTEVMHWHMSKDYHVDMIMCDDYVEHSTYVFKLGGKYIKTSLNKDYTHNVEFVEPKTKTIIYFD